MRIDVPQFINAKALGGLKGTPKAITSTKPILRDVKVAKERQKRDVVASLDLEGETKRYYLQGYGANIYEQNPYERSSTLAFHAWAAGFFDKYGF